MREVSSSSVMSSTDVHLRRAPEGQQTGVIVGVSLPLIVIVGLMLLALTLFAMFVSKRRKKTAEDTHLQHHGLGKHC